MQRFLNAWRRSLQIRTVSLSVSLSLLAVVAIGGYMTLWISANLFEQRRDEVVAETVLAAEAASETFVEAIASTTTSSDMDAIRSSALDASRGVISNVSDTYVALFRSDNQTDDVLAMGDIQSQGFDSDLLTPEMRAQVATGQSSAYYQSIEVRGPDGSVSPALIVGTTVEVPRSGTYEFYVIATLENAQATLEFTQLTMALGGLAVVVLIGLVTWMVVRLVVGPVRVAAEASARLAEGELDERVPVRGDDALAALGRNFNTMADSLQRQIEDLEKLSTVQQRFVSDVSHELRTPLTTIRLAGGVIYAQSEGFNPETRRSAELLYTQIERFDTLLADLIELSRFDAGAVMLELEPTNLVQLAQNEMDAVQPLADDRGSELVLVAPGGHFETGVDPRRIRRILQNLLGNAIDHGEGKPIEVIVDSNSSATAIAVRDHGVGMTEEQSAEIFGRFWRGDPSRQRSTGGTGLGLAISRDDASLHGGTLDVWSAPGEGSMFRLTLPREDATVVVSPIRFPGEGTV